MYHHTACERCTVTAVSKVGRKILSPPASRGESKYGKILQFLWIFLKTISQSLLSRCRTFVVFLRASGKCCVYVCVISSYPGFSVNFFETVPK